MKRNDTRFPTHFDCANCGKHLSIWTVWGHAGDKPACGKKCYQALIDAATVKATKRNPP